MTLKDFLSVLNIQLKYRVIDRFNKKRFEDIDIFIDDAIEEDGRGHFISMYDGKENEQNGFYIYRME